MSGNTIDAAPCETAPVSAKYASCHSIATAAAAITGTDHLGSTSAFVASSCFRKMKASGGSMKGYTLR